MNTPTYKTVYARSLKPTLEMPRDQLADLVAETGMVPSTGHRAYRIPRMALGTKSEADQR